MDATYLGLVMDTVNEILILACMALDRAASIPQEPGHGKLFTAKDLGCLRQWQLEENVGIATGILRRGRDNPPTTVSLAGN